MTKNTFLDIVQDFCNEKYAFSKGETPDIVSFTYDALLALSEQVNEPTPSSAEVYRKALQELVDLKETKESVNFITNGAIKADYEKRKPLAWAAAKEILSHSSQPEQTLNWEKVGDDLTDILFNANGTGAGADDIVVYLRQLLSVAKVGQPEQVKGEEQDKLLKLEIIDAFSEYREAYGRESVGGGNSLDRFSAILRNNLKSKYTITRK